MNNQDLILTLELGNGFVHLVEQGYGKPYLIYVANPIPLGIAVPIIPNKPDKSTHANGQNPTCPETESCTNNNSIDIELSKTNQSAGAVGKQEKNKTSAKCARLFVDYDSPVAILLQEAYDDVVVNPRNHKTFRIAGTDYSAALLAQGFQKIEPGTVVEDIIREAEKIDFTKVSSKTGVLRTLIARIAIPQIRVGFAYDSQSKNYGSNNKWRTGTERIRPASFFEELEREADQRFEHKSSRGDNSTQKGGNYEQ